MSSAAAALWPDWSARIEKLIGLPYYRVARVLEARPTMRSVFSQWRSFPIPRRAAVALVVLATLAWSNLAFCGAIHDAARDGDMARVKALLNDNPGLVFSKDETGKTPLLWAAGEGHRNLVELLLASGADVNAQDNDGETALHLAVYGDHRDVVEFLLANHANVNARTRDRVAGAYNGGVTPLHVARSKDMAELLLASGADVNAQDSDGTTPLHDAAIGQNRDMMELLLANHAVVDARDNCGQTALYLAVQLAGPGVVERDKKHVVELLLTHGADVNGRTRDNCNGGETPLHDAARNCQREVAELLLAHGANVNAKDAQGSTPLLEAARGVESDLSGCIPPPGNSECPPVTLTASKCRKEMVELLRQHGGHE